MTMILVRILLALIVVVMVVFWMVSGVYVFVSAMMPDNRDDKIWSSIRKVVDKGNTDTATFIMPGFLSPGIEHFQPYIEGLPGDVYFCDYGGVFWSENAISKRIEEIISSQPYKKVEFLSMSFACKVAYHLTTFSGITERVDVKSIMVCPIVRGEMMSKSLRVVLIILLPLIALITIAIFGPLVSLRLIKIKGVAHSATDLVSQAFSMVYDSRPCLLGIRKEEDELVISLSDKVVNIAKIYNSLAHKDFKVVTGNFPHANIDDDFCYFAVQRAGAFDEF